MDGAKLAEAHPDSYGLRIFGVILSGLECSAIGIRLAGARERRLDGLAGGSHHTDIQTRHGDPVTGFRHGVFGIGEKLGIGLLEKRVGRFSRLDVGAMIDEFANGTLAASSAMPPKWSPCQ